MIATSPAHPPSQARPRRHVESWCRPADHSCPHHCEPPQSCRNQPRDGTKSLIHGFCATAFRLGGSDFASGFDELRDLCIATDDERSLAIGMSGQVMEDFFDARYREASILATQHVRLLESVGDPTLTVGLLSAAMSAKHAAGEIAEVLRLAERVIELAGGDATKGKLVTGSPLTIATAMRGLARSCRGITGWRGDFDKSIAMARAIDPLTRGGVAYFTHVLAIVHGVVLPDHVVDRETAEALTLAEQLGEDVA